MSKYVIPRKSIYRLSVYQRCLQRLKNNNVERVSSEALARAAGVKSTQLRKDLAYFGQFGTRGLGYNIEDLSQKLTEVLGTARLQPVVLIGVGNLGSALLRYQGFNKEGFEILAAFDSDPRIVESAETSVPLHPMAECEAFIRERGIKVAILTIPARNAQEVTNTIVEAGVQAILNFAPIILQVPENVVVNNVDLALELENLSYFIR
jgi:redox-sensing transcriptional repressor